ncbi:MAG: hypothetical protein V4523_07980 [Pseudomonadota bacterium]
MPIATYTQHENGTRGFPAKRAPQYAKRFKVSEEWLLYGKGDEPTVEIEPIRSIAMPVPLPSVSALTDMFVALLEQVDVDPHEGERAEKLARSFPGVLQAALLRQAGWGGETLNILAKPPRADGEDLPSP